MSAHQKFSWISRTTLALLLLAPQLTDTSFAQIAPPMEKPSGVAAKIQPSLGQVLADTSKPTGVALNSLQLSRTDSNDRVQVYIHLNDLSDSTLSELASAGAKVDLTNKELGIVQAWLPADAVEAIAASDAVNKITLPGYRRLRQGSVTSEGDAIMLANKARLAGARGQGVKVGAISDGIDNRAAAQATGDLPAIITIDPAHPGDGDSGTALLEIVHDVAPMASLYFSGPQTSLEFIASLNYLVNTAQCDVIFDDIGFYDEPYFEDGPVADAVQAIVGSVVYVSAAGNDHGMHYQGPYEDVSLTQSNWPYNLHKFAGNTDVTQQLVIPPDTQVAVFLQWSDSFGSSANDYDLYLYDNAPNKQFLVGSNGRQNGAGDDPFESLVYTNTGSTPVTVNIVINRYSGNSKRLELYVWGGSELQFASTGDSIFGHPTVPGVLSVGAIHAATPTSIAPNSSRGPSILTFPALTTRQTPSVVAIDGVSVTGAGGFPTTFYGSSAAAAHAAAIAALTINGHPAFTSAQIVDEMVNTATDLGVAGYDNIYGAGLLNAQDSVGLPGAAVQGWTRFR